MTNEQRCRRCTTPHADHPDASSKGGLGRSLAWRDGYCPVCLDKHREWNRWAALHIVAASIDPDDSYCEPSSEHPTLPSSLEEALRQSS